MTLCCSPNSASNAASMTTAATVRAPSPMPATIDALVDEMHTADGEVGVGDESDQVKKGDQENYIDRDAIGRNQGTAGGTAGGLR